MGISTVVPASIYSMLKTWMLLDARGHKVLQMRMVGIENNCRDTDGSQLAEGVAEIQRGFLCEGQIFLPSFINTAHV